MKLKKIWLAAMLTALFTAQGFALKMTFDGITPGSDAEKLMNKYVNDFAGIMDPVFTSMANSCAVSNAVQPVFGKPYHSFALGFNAGVAASDMKFDENKAGGKALNLVRYDFPVIGVINPITLGVAAAPYLTISLDPLAGIFGLDFFENSDITVKLLSLNIAPKMSDSKTDFDIFNFGLIFRKQIINEVNLVPVLFSFTGISFSGGIFYSSNKIKSSEDRDGSDPESVNISANGVSGEIIFADKGYDLSMDITSFTLDGDIKAYVNLLYFLDLYAGAGLSFNLANYMSVSGTYKGDISVEIGGVEVDNTSAGLTISGKQKGNVLVPRLMMGTQINLWVLKIGAQYAVAFGKDTIKNINLGVSVAF